MKSLTAFFLVFSITFLSLFSLPTKKAQAFLGDSVSGTAQLAMKIADAVARAAAQAILQKMIDSTVEWAKSGFEGNPAYATNPKQYFTDIADGVAGEFIYGSDLGFLCSPFQTQVRLALLQQYVQPDNFQCTLTDIVGNIEDFYSDFDQGGWDAWFSMTQNNANNPYGAFLDAQVELDRRLQSAIELENKQLDWNQGFLSWSECLETNPPPDIVQLGGGTNVTGQLNINPKHIPGKAVGECIRRGPTKTPGTVIKSQLDKVLPSTMDRFINAQHLEDLIGAFVTGALNRYVFSSDGLFSDKPPPPLPDPVQPAQLPDGLSGGNNLGGGTGTGSGNINDQSQQCLAVCLQNFCPSGDAVDPSCNLTGLRLCANACAS